MECQAALETGRARRLRVREAEEADREVIYRLRHEVYARELGQHPVQADGTLCDGLDGRNVYLLAEGRSGLAGFVSITPPGDRYAIEKYLRRESLPFAVHDRLYEVRLLTVAPARRRGGTGAILMLAALRWIEQRGGSDVVCIGRREVLPLYLHAGLHGTGIPVRSGAVDFEVLHANVAELSRASRCKRLQRRIERAVEWCFDVPVRRAPACFHGGAFFEAIGEDFAALERRRTIINADVLDAWFPPAPAVLAELRHHLGWLVRTSPPAAARGMLPTYGEYAHVLEEVIGCRVDRLRLRRDEGYAAQPEELAAAIARGYDLVVLVNPNSPTGRHLGRAPLEAVLQNLPRTTRMWIDETYVEYVGSEQSLEQLASRSQQVVVCKSMSKVYALSGLRAAYLCGPPSLISDLRALTPPWAVGLPAQVAAVSALGEGDYYRRRYAETHRLRERLHRGLVRLGLDPVPGAANFLLVHMPERGPAAPTATALLARCRARGLFLRDTASLSRRLQDRAFRIAVKDAATTTRMLAILRDELRGLSPATPPRPALRPPAPR